MLHAILCASCDRCTGTKDVLLQIVKKVELEAQRAKGPNEAKGGRRRRNPVEDLKREVAIMRTLRHKNIVSLQVRLIAFAQYRSASTCTRDVSVWQTLN